MMKTFKRRLSFVGVVTFLVAGSAHAANYGMAGCGIGAMAFGDEPGKIQIVAATLNNILVPQTSAISSGTSNCTAEGAGQRVALFVAVNQEALKKDAARGEGETINSLAEIMQCSDRALLGDSLQQDFGKIFSGADSSGIAESIGYSVKSRKDLRSSCGMHS